MSPPDSADLQRARDNIARAILVSPFEGPMDPLIWDGDEINRRSGMIENLFGEDLRALAAAGDLSSLLSFFNAPWMDAVQRHRDRGEWAQSLFRVASADILPALIDELATANAMNASSKPAQPTVSPVWRQCAGIALGRANGDPAVLAAVKRHLFSHASSDSEAIERLPRVLRHAFREIAPNDLRWALGLASQTFPPSPTQNDLTSAHEFVLKTQAIFADLFPPRPQGFLTSPPVDPLVIERAREFLQWAAEIQLSDEDYPISKLLLSLSESFCRAPELAPSLARLFESHNALQGCGALAQFNKLNVAIAPQPLEAPPSWNHPSLQWESKRMSPVDQALAWDSEDGALALCQAGFAWSSASFINSCKDALTGPQSDSPWASAIVRAMTRAERLELFLTANAAPKSTGGPARI